MKELTADVRNKLQVIQSALEVASDLNPENDILAGAVRDANDAILRILSACQRLELSEENT